MGSLVCIGSLLGIAGLQSLQPHPLTRRLLSSSLRTSQPVSPSARSSLPQTIHRARSVMVADIPRVIIGAARQAKVCITIIQSHMDQWWRDRLGS